MKTSKFAFEIIWPLRHTYTPHSQQVRPRSNSQKQPKTVKKKKERAYYRETFFVLHLKISGFILWLFSPSTSSITRVGYSTFLFCSLLMSPLKRKEYIYLCYEGFEFSFVNSEFLLFQVNEIYRKTIIPCDFFFDMKMANFPPLHCAQ